MSLSEKESLAFLRAKATDLGVELLTPQGEELLKLKELVLKWNSGFRLTAITADRDFLIKHILDSLAVVPFLPERGVVLDVGAGAGFPGLVIAVVRPELNVIMAEAAATKCSFLKEVIKVLKLERARVLHRRLSGKRWRLDSEDRVDAVVSRAAIPLVELLSLGEKLCRQNGRIVAMKGPQYDEELKAVKSTLSQMDVALEKIYSLILPGSDIKRYILIFNKTEAPQKTKTRLS